jgi:hypothetical protein
MGLRYFDPIEGCWRVKTRYSYGIWGFLLGFGGGVVVMLLS